MHTSPITNFRTCVVKSCPELPASTQFKINLLIQTLKQTDKENPENRRGSSTMLGVAQAHPQCHMTRKKKLCLCKKKK